MDWLARLLSRRDTLVLPRETLKSDDRGRAARIVAVLSFYADRKNYDHDRLLKESCRVWRDGGRRARQLLALLRELECQQKRRGVGPSHRP